MELNDKLRDFTNDIKMQGPLTELDVKRGKNEKTGNEWLRISGAIQFGEHAVMSKRFDTGIIARHKKNEDGSLMEEDKPMFKKMNEFAMNVKPLFDGPKENTPIVYLRGAFATNNYVNSQEKLIESIVVRPTQLSLNPRNYEGPMAEPSVEGMIYSVAPETAGEEKTETGRLRVTLLTVDFFKNLIPVKNIIVTEENRDYFEDYYQKGCTAKLYLEWQPHIGETTAPKAGGFGKKRVTTGNSYLELVCTGAEAAIDEDDDKAFPPASAKVLMQAYKQSLEELKAAGYRGSQSSTSATTSSPAFGSRPKSMSEQRATIMADMDVDDDMPF